MFFSFVLSVLSFLLLLFTLTASKLNVANEEVKKRKEEREREKKCDEEQKTASKKENNVEALTSFALSFDVLLKNLNPTDSLSFFFSTTINNNNCLLFFFYFAVSTS